MDRDERDLLSVLRTELEFLAQGGYVSPVATSWRPSFIFEDSPTCANFGRLDDRVPCENCALIQLVPSEFHSEKAPCRHIALTSSGETLESLYCTSHQHEVEETVIRWLRETIKELEAGRRNSPAAVTQTTSTASETLRGTPLHEHARPICANPACPTNFHWMAGGKFFRFRSSASAGDLNHTRSQRPANVHGVKHYWLCEPCSHIFTLVYEEDFGVTLKLVRLELPLTELNKEWPAA